MNDKTFEWYYFDIHTPDGYDIVFTLHTKPFSSVFDVTIWDIFVYKENRLNFHHFLVTPQSDLKFIEEPFLIRGAEHTFLRKAKDFIEISVRDDKINLSLQLKNKLPASESLEVELLPEADHNAYFKWVVFAPLCESRGKLIWNGAEINLEGTAYHDYNAGNINLRKRLKSWFWGKYYWERELIVFGEVLTRKGQKKNIMLHIAPNGMTMDGAPQKIIQKDCIYLKGMQKDFRFTLQDQEKLDDIRFYISTYPKILSPLAKIRETLAFLSLQKPAFSIISKILTNVRYYRHRSTGLLNGHHKTHSFTEKMLF